MAVINRLLLLLILSLINRCMLLYRGDLRGRLLDRQPRERELHIQEEPHYVPTLPPRITTNSKSPMDEEETKSPHADASPNEYESVDFLNPNFRNDGDDATAQDNKDATAQDDKEEIEKTAL